MPDNPNNPTPQESPLAEKVIGSEVVHLNVPFPETFIYSNVAAFSTTIMDVHVSFGEALPNRQVIAKVGISMTPEHAANVALSLLQQLTFFEQHFGQIRHDGWQLFKPVLEHLPQVPQNPPPEPAPIKQ